MTMGIVFYKFKKMVRSIYFLIFAFTGGVIFVTNNYNNAPFIINSFKYLGGLMVVFYTSTSFFQVVKKWRENRNFISMFFTIIVYFFYLIFFAVYVVAYKFVPYGWVFRERTPSMILSTILLIGWSQVEMKQTVSLTKTKPNLKKIALKSNQNWQIMKMVFLITFLVVFLVVVPSVIYRVKQEMHFKPTVQENDMIKSGKNKK